MSEIIDNMRNESRGRKRWEVRNKHDRSLCMWFWEYNQFEANDWWREHSDYHEEWEMVLVNHQTRLERLASEAADMLEFLLGQMKITSADMGGNHSYRFISTGWPMTHCKGPNAEEAIRAVLTEIRREKEESRDPRLKALEELAAQAQELNMGYGPPEKKEQGETACEIHDNVIWSNRNE